MTSDKQLYKLEVRASGLMEEFAHLSIENGYMEQVAKGYHRLTAELPKGLYHITLRLNEGVEEQYVTLDRDKTDVTLHTPPIVSAVVAANFSSTHEYYSDQVKKYATEVTCHKRLLPVSAAGNSSLLLFFRYLDHTASAVNNKRRRSLGKGFSLLGPDRKRLALLRPPHIAQDIAYGWMAFQAALAPGVYYLSYEGKGANREIPLYVANGWQTQLFMMFGSEPLFASARIAINNPTDYYAFSHNNAVIEGAVQKMQNGIYYFPPQELNAFVNDKWYNPMLALLAAYVYFLNPKSSPDTLYQTVVENLGHILGNDCPDVQALQIMAAKHYGHVLPAITVKAPCMLLAGMRAIVRATSQNEEIIADGSIADKIATRLYTDTLWTTYRPDTLDGPLKQMAKAEYRKIKQHVKYSLTNTIKNTIKNGLQDIIDAQNVQTAAADTAEAYKVDDWMADMLLNYTGRLSGKLDINTLAEYLQAPPKTVRKAIAAIIANEAYYGRMQDAGPDYKSSIKRLKAEL